MRFQFPIKYKVHTWKLENRPKNYLNFSVKSQKISLHHNFLSVILSLKLCVNYHWCWYWMLKVNPATCLLLFTIWILFKWCQNLLTKLLHIWLQLSCTSFITNYSVTLVLDKSSKVCLVSFQIHLSLHDIFYIIDRRRMMARQSVGQEFVILITLLAGVCSAQRHHGVMGKSTIFSQNILNTLCIQLKVGKSPKLQKCLKKSWWMIRRKCPIFGSSFAYWKALDR